MKITLLFIYSIIIGIILVIGVSEMVPISHIRSSIASHHISPQSVFSLEKAPSKSIKGIIESFSGDTEWESRTATRPAAFTILKTIQQGESIVTKDTGKAFINFTNMASISVFPNTTINIIQTLPVNLVLEQTSGTANYIKTGTTPLSIRTEDLLTNLNGQATIFIDTNQQEITVTMQSGTATEAYNDSQNNSTLVTVNQDKQFVFDETGKQVRIE